MAPALARAVVLPALLVGAAVFAGCGGDHRAPEAAPGLVTTTPNSPPPTIGGAGAGVGTGPYVGPCLELSEPAPAVDWLPEDLPLPEGTYTVLDLPTGEEDFRRAVLAVPMEYDDFLQFAADEWPSHDWETQQTEVEPGEADTVFIRGREVGSFQARRVYCEENWSEILLSYGIY